MVNGLPSNTHHKSLNKSLLLFQFVLVNLIGITAHRCLVHHEVKLQPNLSRLKKQHLPEILTLGSSCKLVT